MTTRGPSSLLACAMALIGIWGSVVVHGQRAAPEDRVKRALVLAVAKVGTNEAAWNEPEIRLVWQTAETRASTSHDRLRWLRAHSPRVLQRNGHKRCTQGRGNCWWTRNLTWAAGEPRGWRELYPGWPWTRFRGEWLRALEAAEDVVSGRDPRRPCIGSPWTWGGPQDRRAAIARGLRPLRCVGTRNTGYALGRRRGDAS